MEDRSATPLQSTSSDVKSPTQRPLYSSKLGDQRKEATPSGQTARQSAPVTKAWTPSSRNPLTGRSQNPQSGFNSQNKQSVTNSLREGQRVRITISSGAEFEGTYSNGPDSSNFRLTNVQQKKLPNSAELANGARREQTQMMVQKKDVMEARVVPGNAGKNDGKGANGNGGSTQCQQRWSSNLTSFAGNRSGFKTDSSISNSRLGAGRALQPWTPPPDTTTDFSLESSKDDARGWDQFATHERMFGKKSDYDERIYTTEIDKSHPHYEQRIAQADKIARLIEGEAPKFAHVAEERIMDFAGGDGRDEEEKYSGVARQDYPPLNPSRENKYTPPARRAPTGQSTVKGAPVDPAIISSQLKGAPASAQQPAPKVEDVKAPAVTPTPAQPATEKTLEPKADNKTPDAKAPEAKPGVSAASSKPETKETAAPRPSAASTRVAFPAKIGGPITTTNVEREVLNAFKAFSIKERKQVDAARHSKARVDKEVKLTELKKFSKDFKLSTPVPKDLIPIIAKDPAKQQEIQEKALQNAADIAKKRQAEAALKEKESAAAKASQTKATAEQSNASTPAATTDSRASSRPTAPQHSNSSGAPGRHNGPRASYHNNNGAQPPYGGQYNRNGRGAQLPPGAQATGQLAQRLRNVEQQKMQHPHMAQHPQPDMRLPPTGPANNADPAYGRRISGVPPNYLGPKLNPNSHEFRPNAFAQPFNPMNPINPITVIPSQASSPRSSVNNIMEVPIMPPPAKGQLVRRKTKAIDIKKCFVLANMETIQPASNPKKTWDDNDGFRPAFDHPPTWRAVDPEKEEPKDSTMSMTYNEYFEKVPRSGAAIATPNPTHAMPQIPHQHQLPPYLQHGGQGMAHRQSPHMPPMQMQGGQHGHGPHGPYNPEDHRMMHSNSAQSFASPRMGQVPMAYPPAVNAPGQMPYGQPVMPPYMNPGAPQMGQFRSFSNNPQFMPQQPHHMGAPIMGQPPFIPPNGMAVSGPMYPVSGPPFNMPPGAVPPQPMVGSNGFPSPGRSAAAPMMAHQGSHQGQPAVYGMSPAMTYQQPAYNPQQGQGKFSGQRPPQ
ncbi:putative PAB1-binding protein [Triangularia verruculosa]|uniref:PAB1-binding protein n=1 Tax=Triangularia verruculosa TaxID=2587418 RepID=A0AAN6XC03_9PEZI|nr:putative PAB1-binding protein [Triangularia verruculosa]